MFSLKKLGLSAVLLLGWPMITASVSYRDNFDQRILAAHNRERATLGLPALQWNDRLSKGAKEWSDFLAHNRAFRHSPDLPGQERLGENIWGGTPGAYGPEAMVALWVAEKRNFQVGVFPDNSRTGRVGDISHYTQVMWHSTTEVGCAISRGAEEILVCRYSSPGNIIGQTVY